MKKVYFVRHGESEGNVGLIGQSATTPLTEKGRNQAAIVAERCAKLPVETIVCSTMDRARETAKFILNQVSKPIDYSDFFGERRRPSVITDKPKDDFAALEIVKTIEQNFHLPGYRFSDEENFEDLKKRARAALQYLADRPEQNILVVTHGFFMRIVMAYVLFGEQLTGKECLNCVRTFHMENTGITMLGYNESEKDHPWWLWIWNDHAHLG